jgi:hypothetical protein
MMTVGKSVGLWMREGTSEFLGRAVTAGGVKDVESNTRSTQPCFSGGAQSGGDSDVPF